MSLTWRCARWGANRASAGRCDERQAVRLVADLELVDVTQVVAVDLPGERRVVRDERQAVEVGELDDVVGVREVTAASHGRQGRGEQHPGAELIERGERQLAVEPGGGRDGEGAHAEERVRGRVRGDGVERVGETLAAGL